MIDQKRIRRRTFMKHSAVLGMASAFGLDGDKTLGLTEGATEKKEQKRPNLLFVFPDQMRRHAMGFMKQDPVITPVLDRFSDDSIVFTHATSTHPLCSPYRGSLFTGLYPHRSGLPTNCHSSRRNVYLRRETTTLTDILARGGYDVGYIGKWHLKTPDEGHGYHGPWIPPEDRHSTDFWYIWSDKHRNNFQPSYWKNDAQPDELIVPGRVWSAIHETNVAVDYLYNKNKAFRDENKPFALFVSWNPPHDPYTKAEVPKEYYDQYGDAVSKELLNRDNVVDSKKTEGATRHARGYFASVTGIDDQFGRILQALKSTGLEEDTLVVFTSDHGEMLGSHGLMTKNQCYEESFGIPLLMRWKGRLLPRRDDLLIGTPDLMPTLLALLGLGDKIPAGIHGKDLSAAVQNEKQAHRPEIAWYFNASNNARGLRTHKMSCFFDRKKDATTDLLFNLNDDPYQMHNLAKARPDLLKEFGAQTYEWLKNIGDDFSDYQKKGAYLNTIPV
ncbi:sulfatase [Fulvivirgaceae bacterium BMA12]|uniref:Sulfatase n=1 Tax=Agaribacillus aureus TaxID=3051825 RepID=A0ABT8L6K9_9BACT|nr:sulfatase [Fulvivirgaceae bacterium BMA12]